MTIDRLGFVGPLQHPNSIKVDISLREKVQVPPRQVLVETPYDLSFTVTCMALEEILAEKIRATLMRRTPRDYYDLWFLLQREDIDLRLLPSYPPCFVSNCKQWSDVMSRKNSGHNLTSFGGYGTMT